MTAELAVCYVADLNFLFGTLTSLRSLRRFVPKSLAEIYLFYLDPDPGITRQIERAVLPYDVTLLPLPVANRIDVASKSWNKTHVPPSALGRFYIESYLPEYIQRILYIDGDTLFVRDPSGLIDFVPAEGTLAAVDDACFFARRDWSKFGREMRTYFRGLKINWSKGYLNSGLLMAQRGAWKAIVADAVRYFEEHSDRCRYHDQSALNEVVGERRVRLSPRWNFQTPFCYWNIHSDLEPSILHFTGFPKPWMGEIAPWIFAQGQFDEDAGQFADLALPVNRLSQESVENYNQMSKRISQRLNYQIPIRLWKRREEMRRLVEDAVL
jgi:lipopolysaccharide biosynthesis glycosyltransferase